MVQVGDGPDGGFFFRLAVLAADFSNPAYQQVGRKVTAFAVGKDPIIHLNIGVGLDQADFNFVPPAKLVLAQGCTVYRLDWHSFIIGIVTLSVDVHADVVIANQKDLAFFSFDRNHPPDQIPGSVDNRHSPVQAVIRAFINCNRLVDPGGILVGYFGVHHRIFAVLRVGPKFKLLFKLVHPVCQFSYLTLVGQGRLQFLAQAGIFSPQLVIIAQEIAKPAQIGAKLVGSVFEGDQKSRGNLLHRA